MPSASPSGMFVNRFADLPPVRPVAQPVPLPEFVSPEERRRIEADVPFNPLGPVRALLKPFELESQYVGRPITQGLQTVNRALMTPFEQIPYLGPQVERARETVEPISQMVGENVFVPSNLLPGIGFGDDLAKPFMRGLERQGGVRGLGRRLVGEEVGGANLGRAELLAENRRLKTLIQEGGGTAEDEARLAEVRIALQRGTMPPEATSGLEHSGPSGISDIPDAAGDIGSGRAFSAVPADEIGRGVRGRPLGEVENSLQDYRLGEGAAGTPPRPPVDLFPEPPEPPSWEDAVGKLKRGLKESARKIAPNEVERSLERRQRLAIYEDILQRERAAGTPTEEALTKARAALSGEYSKFIAPEFGLTEAESEALWKHVADFDYGGKTFKQVNAAQAMTRIAAGEPLRRFEIRLLREVFGDDFGKLLEKASVKASMWDKLVNTITIPRTVLSSFDVSYPFRQGAKVMVRHPKEFYSDIGAMINAWRKQAVADLVDEAIRNDDMLVPVAGRHGGQSMTWGEIADNIDILRPLEGGGLREGEEGFLSNLARRIPGVKQSERAFVTYGNKLRSDIGKYWVQRWIKNGVEITPKKLDDLGAVLNRLTGRGTLGKNVLADTVQALGWAPRYRASGPQAFLQMFHKDPQIRRVAIENVLSFFGAGMAALTLAKVSGAADVEIDPRSTDFGKLRFGNLRLNVWGTDQVLARNIAQIVTGEKKTDTGEIKSIAASGPLKKYLRSGLAPENALVYDLLTGENYSGQNIKPDWETVKREWDQRILPLSIQDIVSTWNSEGPLAAAAIAAPSFLGASTSAYEPSFSLKRNQLFEEKAGHPYNPESAAAREFAKNDPDLKALSEQSKADAQSEGRDNLNLSEKSKKEIAQLEEDQGIPRLAKQGLAGNPNIAAQWNDIRKDFLATRAGIYIANSKDYGEPKTEAGKLADQYYRMNPKSPEYMDDNGEVDWDKYDADRKAILAKMTPEDAAAIQDSDKFQDPDAEKFDRQYREAKEIRNSSPQKFKGVSKDQQEAYYDFSRKVADERKRLADANPRGRAPTESRVAYTLSKRSWNAAAYKTWRILQSRERQQHLITPQYDAWLLSNRSKLEPFYPDLYSPATIKRLKRRVRRAA